MVDECWVHDAMSECAQDAFREHIGDLIHLISIFEATFCCKAGACKEVKLISCTE